MKEFDSKEEQLIKEMQEVLIKNTSNLPLEIRSAVYSKFQALKYCTIDLTDMIEKYGLPMGAVAAFLPTENKICIMDCDEKSVLQPSVLLHEMIHGVSFSADPRYRYLGFGRNGLSSVEKITKDSCELYFPENRAINEGLTEFFTKRFLNIKFNASYPFIVHITELLCDACGYENLKEIYFSQDFERLKKTIKQNFHLPNDSLTEKLFSEMDILLNSYIQGKYSTKTIPLIKNCYRTLLEMQQCKTFFETGKILSQTEIRKYLNNHSNPYFIKENLSIVLDLIQENKFLKEPINNKKFTSSFGRSCIGIFANLMLKQNYKDLTNYGRALTKNKSCDSNMILEILHKANQQFVLTQGDKVYPQKTVLNNFLIMLHDKNKKIDLSKFTKAERQGFLTNVLFSPYNLDDPCKHFYTEDLIEYINSGTYEYQAFCNIYAMSKIYEQIKDVSPKVREHEEFVREYNNVKYGTREIIDNLKF